MIAYLKGTLVSIGCDNAVVEVNDIGYRVLVSAAMAASLPTVGSLVKIHTYTYVKEDAFLLYGFCAKEELEIFKQLIAVSGIGPKGALSILSVMSVSELRLAIVTKDVNAIKKAPGIGAKTAERLLIDLKDKVGAKEEDLLGQGQDFSEEATCSQNQIKADVLEALVALGYRKAEATKGICSVRIKEGDRAEQVLKAVLKEMV